MVNPDGDHIKDQGNGALAGQLADAARAAMPATSVNPDAAGGTQAEPDAVGGTKAESTGGE